MEVLNWEILEMGAKEGLNTLSNAITRACRNNLQGMEHLRRSFTKMEQEIMERVSEGAATARRNERVALADKKRDEFRRKIQHEDDDLYTAAKEAEDGIRSRRVSVIAKRRNSTREDQNNDRLDRLKRALDICQGGSLPKRRRLWSNAKTAGETDSDNPTDSSGSTDSS